MSDSPLKPAMDSKGTLGVAFFCWCSCLLGACWHCNESHFDVTSRREDFQVLNKAHSCVHLALAIVCLFAAVGISGREEYKSFHRPVEALWSASVPCECTSTNDPQWVGSPGRSIGKRGHRSPLEHQVAGTDAKKSCKWSSLRSAEHCNILQSILCVFFFYSGCSSWQSVASSLPSNDCEAALAPPKELLSLTSKRSSSECGRRVVLHSLLTASPIQRL